MRKTIFIAAIFTAAIFASSVLAQTAILQSDVACTQSAGQCSGGTPICVGGNCVAATCGITPTGGLTFSGLVPGTTSGLQEVTFTNGGNTPTTSFAVYGNDWTQVGYGGSCNLGNGLDWNYGQPCFAVGTTQASQDNTNWYALSGSPGLTGFYSGAISNGPLYGLDFTVTPPVNTPAGTYYQTITFTSGC